MRDCTITSIFLLIRSSIRNEKNVHHPNLSFWVCVCMCECVCVSYCYFSILLLPVFMQFISGKKDQLKLIIFRESFITLKWRRRSLGWNSPERWNNWLDSVRWTFRQVAVCETTGLSWVAVRITSSTPCCVHHLLTLMTCDLFNVTFVLVSQGIYLHIWKCNLIFIIVTQAHNLQTVASSTHHITLQSRPSL